MQTCSRCQTQAPDTELFCPTCGADLREYSTTVIALKKMQANPRVSMIRLAVAADACPTCRRMHGTYPKDQVPLLPVEGCSNGLGCRCFYEPVLTEIYP